MPLIDLEICEYCNVSDVILYAWHGDIWCGPCAQKYNEASRISNLVMTGTLEEAPPERPKYPTYAQPFVYQTPDGKVIGGRMQYDEKVVLDMICKNCYMRIVKINDVNEWVHQPFNSTSRDQQYEFCKLKVAEPTMPEHHG